MELETLSAVTQKYLSVRYRKKYLNLDERNRALQLLLKCYSKENSRGGASGGAVFLYERMQT